MSQDRRHLCFVSPNAYDALSGEHRTRHIGGAEVQVVALARGLADRGHQVSFITWGDGESDGQIVNGIRVFKMCRRLDGWPGLRFLHPRWTSLNAALGRAAADIYCQSIANGETGQVAHWCRRHGRCFFFIVMSDVDCDVKPPPNTPWRHALLRRYGLRHADLIVAQTRRQQDLLRAHLHRPNDLVRPCIATFPDSSPDRAPSGGDGRHHALWVGRFAPMKRVEWVLDLAESLPEWVFDIVGSVNQPTDYATALCHRASRIPNVVLHGHVPHGEVAAFYRRARLFVLTSVWEGFPTTFMEAWSHGLPTITTVDPDELVTTHGLGAVGATVAQLATAMRRLGPNDAEWAAASDRARHYVRSHHSVEAAVEAFERILTRQGNARPARRASEKQPRTQPLADHPGSPR